MSAAILKVIGAVERRILLARTLEGAARGLGIGAWSAIAVATVLMLVGAGSWRWLALVVALVVTTVAIVRSRLARVRSWEAAELIDRRAGLADRTLTAAQALADGAKTPVAELLYRDAAKQLTGVDPRNIVELPSPRRFAGPGLAALVMLLVVVWPLAGPDVAPPDDAARFLKVEPANSTPDEARDRSSWPRPYDPARREAMRRYFAAEADR